MHDNAGRGWGGRRISGPRGGRRRRPRCSRASVRTRRGPCAATSASVERLFSVAGQVVTAKRARLDPSTVTLLVFLHEAIPGGIEREAYEIIEAVLRVQCTLGSTSFFALRLF
jgi:hypothetical protein